MKSLEYYLNLPYEFSIIPEEEYGGFVAMIPDLPGCLSSGATPEEAIKSVREAQKDWISAALEDGVQIKEPRTNEFSGNLRLRMPKSLHMALAVAAKREGVSMNQYCNYAIMKTIKEGS